MRRLGRRKSSWSRRVHRAQRPRRIRGPMGVWLRSTRRVHMAERKQLRGSMDGREAAWFGRRSKRPMDLPGRVDPRIQRPIRSQAQRQLWRQIRGNLGQWITRRIWNRVLRGRRLVGAGPQTFELGRVQGGTPPTNIAGSG